jgi:hypothetical protein
MVGSGVVAVLALCALASASASAAPPELGRCVLAETPKTGEYKNARCTAPSLAGKGNYNFLPGPGEKPKFEGTGSEPRLEMPGLAINCAASTFNGEYTGAKTASVTVDMIGCVDGATSQKCQSNPLKEGEIETPVPLEGELGFIKWGAGIGVGLDLTRSPALVTFECGKPPEATITGVVEGSVIGHLAPTNLMSEEFKLRYRTAGGKQVPEQFEGGTKDTLSVKLTSGLTTTTEEAVFKEKLVEILNEEPLEIKKK